MRRIVLAQRLREGAKGARESLSAIWRRDADIVRRKAVVAEHRAERAVSKWLVRLRPRVVHLEHRLDHAAKALAKHARRHPH